MEPVARPGPGSWRVQPAAAGVRIEIRPCRDWLGAFAFSLGGGLAAAFVAKLAPGLFPPRGSVPWIFGLVVTTIFAATSLGLLRNAVFSLASRHVLELRPAGLRAESFVGPFRQVREYQRERIVWIEVEDGPLSLLEELPWLGHRSALRLTEKGKLHHRVPLGLKRNEAWEIVDLYRRHTERREVERTARRTDTDLVPAPRPASPAGSGRPGFGCVEWFRLALTVWALSFFPVFLVGVFDVAPPRWLEPPWSDLNDYVVAADGRIWVQIGFYNTLLTYDSDGRFLVSLPGPGSQSGGKCLSAAADGRFFLRNYNTVYTLSPDGEEEDRVSGDRKGSRVWRLADDGRVELEADPPAGVLAPNRPVRPGEILFGEECRRPRPHLAYQRPGGGRVLRHLGPWLEIVRPDGLSVSFTGPWYFLWAQLPIPFLPWIVLAVWDGIETRRKKRPNA